MLQLKGFREYLDEHYEASNFNQALESRNPWIFHLHGRRVVSARIRENSIYDLKLNTENEGELDLPKLQVKLVYPAELYESISPLIKTDKKVKALGLGPFDSIKDRHFVKNKSLFPLMKEKQVVFFTLLEGEVVRGVIADFTRYDITVNLKGGLPVTLLRHSIYDFRDKKKRCFLKSFQTKHRDWQMSDLFCE